MEEDEQEKKVWEIVIDRYTYEVSESVYIGYFLEISKQQEIRDEDV